MGSAAQYFEVEAPVEQVYAYWRDFLHFPSFMPDVQEVTVTGPTTSHWKVSGPFGKSVEWDAEIVEDIPNQRIAWRSIGDADVDNAGAVRFDDRRGRPTSRSRWSATRHAARPASWSPSSSKTPTSRCGGPWTASAKWLRRSPDRLSSAPAARRLWPGSTDLQASTVGWWASNLRHSGIAHPAPASPGGP